MTRRLLAARIGRVSLGWTRLLQLQLTSSEFTLSNNTV
jgi:hypothetical protein